MRGWVGLIINNMHLDVHSAVPTGSDAVSSNNSLDKSGGNLKSCHKILLSNYIRQFRVYLDNLDEEETEKTTQMQAKISGVAEKQKITLFHEEEDPDTSLVTKELIQEIMSMSLDMINDLLDYGKDESPPT